MSNCNVKYILRQLLGLYLSDHLHSPVHTRCSPVRPSIFSSTCLRWSCDLHLLIYSDLDSAIYKATIRTVIYFRPPNWNVLHLTNVWTCWSSLVILKYSYNGQILLPQSNLYISCLISLDLIRKTTCVPHKPFLNKEMSILFKKYSSDYVNIAQQV